MGAIGPEDALQKNGLNRHASNSSHVARIETLQRFTVFLSKRQSGFVQEWAADGAVRDERPNGRRPNELTGDEG